MTQEEMLDYNKRCTEFLGFKCSVNEQYELPKMMTFPPKNNSNLCHTAKICCINDMQFHSDWNWIMEVVEAIKIKIGNPKTVTIACFNGDINKALMSAKKEVVIKVINQFLIWYEQKKTI